MQRVLLCMCVAVLSTAMPTPLAHADDCRIDENCDVRVETLDYSGTWRWEASANADLDGRMDAGYDRHYDAAATVGAGLSYDGRSCRWIGLHGELGGYHDGDQAGLTGRQTLTFCLPYPVFRPQLDISLDQDLRPRLEAAPTVRASRVRGGDIRLEAHTLHLSATKGDVVREVRVFVLGMGFGFVTQDVGDAAIRTNELSFLLDIIRGSERGAGFLGQDSELRILRIEGDVRTEAGDDGAEGRFNSAVIDISLFEMESGRIGCTSLYYDLSLGMTVGSLSDTQMEMDGPQIFSPLVIMQLLGGTAEQSYGVGYARGLLPTSYAAVLVEDRLAAWWRRARGGNATTVRGFAALTQVIDVTDQRTRTLTGGVGLSHDMVMGRHARLSLGAEVARSFYADLHGAAPLEAAWVAQVNVRASAFLGSR